MISHCNASQSKCKYETKNRSRTNGSPTTFPILHRCRLRVNAVKENTMFGVLSDENVLKSMFAMSVSKKNLYCANSIYTCNEYAKDGRFANIHGKNDNRLI
ncbi:MAG: hypothetical protein LBU65_07620 [Planctomycetaceae bacterium]|nr:hypothetical protein [Planctomycetaceae bacterium]